MRLGWPIAVALVASVLGDPFLRAQSPTLAFEVASVKPNKSGGGPVAIGIQQGSRYSASNVTPQLLIRQAYQVQLSQIVGGPEWLTRDRLDVVAKVPVDAPSDQIPLMLRAMLADRFMLRTHSEMRELAVYALVKARSDGRLGPSLHPASGDCAAFRARVEAIARSRFGAPPPPPPPGSPAGRQGPTSPFGAATGCGQTLGPGTIVAGGVTMVQLAGILATQLNRIVVDRTGLTDGFDLDLQWTPEQQLQVPPGVPSPPLDPNGPSIFAAVQEQLGLKLESTKGPVDVVVIDHVERPTED